MKTGGKIVVVKKLATHSTGEGKMVTEHFNIGDFANEVPQYFLVPEECRLEIKESDVYLVLIFNRTVIPKGH